MEVVTKRGAFFRVQEVVEADVLFTASDIVGTVIVTYFVEDRIVINVVVVIGGVAHDCYFYKRHGGVHVRVGDYVQLVALTKVSHNGSIDTPPIALRLIEIIILLLRRKSNKVLGGIRVRIIR